MSCQRSVGETLICPELVALLFMDSAMVQRLQAYANTTFGVWQNGSESFTIVK